MIRSLFAALVLLPVLACGPEMKPARHPGFDQFGTACTEAHTCQNDLECMRAAGYGGDTGNCEKRCNYDADCGLDGRCKVVAGAPAPICRGKGG
jgi:hypothetical protein